MKVFHSYGFHKDGNIVFLHEKSHDRCLTPGLEWMDSPFKVELHGSVTCPHQIANPENLEETTHPFIRTMGPREQEGKAFFVRDTHLKLIWDMVDMIPGSAKNVILPWASGLDKKRMVRDLNITNASPMIIVDYEPRHISTLEGLLSVPRMRNLIFCGSMKIKGTEEVEDLPYLINPNWLNIGKTITHEYVREVADA